MNYFEIFEIPVGYKIDETALTGTYLRKQSQVHPDIGGEAGHEESALLNVAYKTLLNPLERAKHFLEIQAKYDADAPDSQFSSEAFNLREKYESLTSPEDKKKFQEELSRRISELTAALYNLENDLDEFRKTYGLARFVASFLEKIKADVYCWN
jgi:molecular chaperone HscB